MPLLPRLAHRLAMIFAQVSIGDPVVIAPGVYVIHGQVVIDGVEIAEGAVIAPFVTIGLRAGDVRGATIERGVNIGTGAKVIGPVRIGAGATVGANAVVVDDVPAGATVVGAPARGPLSFGGACSGCNARRREKPADERSTEIERLSGRNRERRDAATERGSCVCATSPASA